MIPFTPFLVLLALAFLPTSSAKADFPGEYEIPIDVALSPKTGFDDNDTVVVVIHGELPDLCHRLGKNTSRVNETTKTVSLHQYTMAEKSGICDERYPRADYTKMRVPFQAEIQIGNLKPGEYSVKYNIGLTGGTKSRTLGVEQAAVASVDSLNYATVTSVNMFDVVTPSNETTADIQGILNSNCVEIDEFKLISQGDTFIVLPTIREVNPGQPCIAMVRPFRKTVVLGKQNVGHYLLHIRSAGGRAVNRLFEVRD